MFARSALSRSLFLNNITGNLKQIKRNAGHGTWAYRAPPPRPTKKAIFIATSLGALGWWWIFWHLFTEPEHLYGEWPYIPPSTWTDEELGIPPDNKGPLKRK